MSGHSRLAFGASLICFIALAGLFFAIKMWMPFMWALLVPGIFGLLFWLYNDRLKLLDFFMMKSTKHGLNMGVLILIVFTLIGLINYLGAKYYKVIDLSGNKINTLSEQSVQLVKSLDADMRIRFFYKNGADQAEDNKKLFREVVKKYQDISAKVQLEFVEMNEKAKLTQDYGAARGSGEAFIDYKGSKNRIETYTEQDVTNAIIKVTRTEKKTVYFVEGHGERTTDQEKDDGGLAGFKQLLEKNSYVVKKLSLATTTEVPKDANALMILGAKQNFQAAEIKSLTTYLEDGGALLIAFEKINPGGLQALTATLGLDLEKFYVFNVYNTPMGQVVNAQSPTVAVNYSATHPATKVFGPNQMTVYSQPNALKLSEANAAIKFEVIARTPENSVALKDLDSQDYQGNPQSFILGAEIRGKLGKSEKEFSVIAFSDVDFMSNILLYQNLNRDLALNSVAALVKENDLISISPKEPKASAFLVPPPEMNQFLKFVILGLFLPLPLGFMILSTTLWYRRRHA